MQKNRQTRICKRCGKAYERPMSVMKHNAGYCSKKCHFPGISIQCKFCGKLFFIKPYRKHTALFCSRSCHTKFRFAHDPSMMERARQHGLSMKGKLRGPHRSESKYTRSVQDRINISKRLKAYHFTHPGILAKEKNPNWLGGTVPLYKKRLLTAQWKRTTRFVMQRDGMKCVQCGSSERLVVHHKLSWRYGGSDAPANLVTLCCKCHPKRESDQFYDAIFKKCKQCSTDSDPIGCTSPLCPLFPFRCEQARQKN